MSLDRRIGQSFADLPKKIVKSTKIDLHEN